MHVFSDLLIAAMEKPHIGIRLGDDFAIQLENQAQNPVRRWMRWPHVENHPLAHEIVRLGVITFNSLGRASHGVRSLDFVGADTHELPQE